MKFYIKLLILLTGVCLYENGYAQHNHYNGENHGYEQQQFQILSYNVLISGLIGGIGGVINRGDEEFHVAFLKNFGKGALGGGFKYFAKNQVYHLDEPNFFTSQLNRSVYFLGHSITNNASLNRSALASFQMQTYGIQIDLDFEKRNYRARLSTFTLMGLIYPLTYGHSIDFQRSLDHGVWYFHLHPTDPFVGRGFGWKNYITVEDYDRNGYDPELIKHEIIHTFQYHDFQPLTNFFRPMYNKHLKEHRTMNFLNRFFVFDFPHLTYLYMMQPKPTYYRNIFEFEAEHFATRKYVPR